MKRGKMALVLCLLGTGCATYNLDLLPRSQGPMAHGIAKQAGKAVTVTIGQETYTGKFVFVQGGAFTLGTATSGGQFATATGIATSATGNGSILAQAPDGHNLRCVFNASGWSQSGTGVCLTDDGQTWDLQISR